MDSPEVSHRFREKLGAHFTFLCDQERGLVGRLNIRHKARYRGDIAFPTGVLVDKHGVVRWIYEAEFGHMRMTPQDLFDAMERLTLEEQNRELLRSRAVSKVLRQVFLMRGPRDLADAIRVMQDELRALGLSFSICGVAIVSPKADVVTTFMDTPEKGPPEHDVDVDTYVGEDDGTQLMRAELAVRDVPEVEQVVDAWRTQRVRVLRFEKGRCPTALSELPSCCAVHSSEADDGREPVPDPAPTPEISDRGRDSGLRWLVNVPFSHGTVLVGGDGDGDEPSDDDVRTLTEFADAISVAYQRYIDFRELELRNQKLQETQLQLVQSEKMASLGQLVAGVAHELNTPIGAIHSNTQSAGAAFARLSALLSSAEPLDEHAVRELNSSVQALSALTKVNETASRRITEIVSNLRRFARLDESEWKRVDLREGIDETLALVQHETRGRIDIEKSFEDVPPVGCFAGQLNQVFMNLIVNAIHAIDGPGRIAIEVLREGETVVVRVSDSGRGIREPDLGKIFDPGFTTKGVGVGTGLGLAICYQIVQNHGGQISVSSTIGEGSTFTVAVPLNAEPPKAALAQRAGLAPALVKR